MGEAFTAHLHYPYARRQAGATGGVVGLAGHETAMQHEPQNCFRLGARAQAIGRAACSARDAPLSLSSPDRGRARRCGYASTAMKRTARRKGLFQRRAQVFEVCRWRRQRGDRSDMTLGVCPAEAQSGVGSKLPASASCTEIISAKRIHVAAASRRHLNRAITSSNPCTCRRRRMGLQSRQRQLPAKLQPAL